MFFVWLIIYGIIMLFSRYFSALSPWAIPAGLLVSISLLVGWLLIRQKGAFPGFRKVSFSQWKFHLFLLPYLLPALCNLLCFGVRPQSVPMILSIIFAVILEEVIFRVVLLQFFCKWGHIFGILLSTALFAAAHLSNLESGATAVYLLYQVVFALAAGFAFAGLSLSCRSLLPCIAIHFLINITASHSRNLTGEYHFLFWLCIAVYLACGVRNIRFLNKMNSAKKGCLYETIH